MLHSLLEGLRSLLGSVPLPIWLTTAALAALAGWFIEKRMVTRIIIWAVISFLVFLVLYFA